MPSFNATVQTEVEVEFEVFCANCGAGLCGVSTGGNSGRRNIPFVCVEPCPYCIEGAKEKGYEGGYEEGLAEGETRCRQ